MDNFLNEPNEHVVKMCLCFNVIYSELQSYLVQLGKHGAEGHHGDHNVDDEHNYVVILFVPTKHFKKISPEILRAWYYTYMYIYFLCGETKML